MDSSQPIASCSNSFANNNNNMAHHLNAEASNNEAEFIPTEEIPTDYSIDITIQEENEVILEVRYM